MDMDKNEDESENYMNLLITLQNYINNKIPEKRLKPNAQLLSFFNIQSILSKDHISLINLLKLILCISSFCSNKRENMKIISGLDLSLVQTYYDSVYLYLLKNVDKKSLSISVNITSLEDEKNAQRKEIEKLKRIIEEKDSIINQYKASDLIKNNDISVIPTYQDFIGKGDDDMNMFMNFDLNFDLKNKDKNYKIEKTINIYYEKINIKQMFIDSLPTSQKNTNNSSNSSHNYSISKHYFNLSGGEFLHKKIEILDETLLKNREMYQKIVEDYENEIKNLKKEIEELKNTHSEEITQMVKNHENEIKNALNDKKMNYTEELIKFRNEKNIEIEKLRKEMDARESIKDREIEKIKNNINKLKINRQKDIELFESEKMKVKYEYEQKINNLNYQLQTTQIKLKSDPYFAREIMSKTLYNFAATIMSEN